MFSITVVPWSAECSDMEGGRWGNERRRLNEKGWEDVSEDSHV